jgi:hypothetical protein
MNIDTAITIVTEYEAMALRNQAKAELEARQCDLCVERIIWQHWAREEARAAESFHAALELMMKVKGDSA